MRPVAYDVDPRGAPRRISLAFTLTATATAAGSTNRIKNEPQGVQVETVTPHEDHGEGADLPVTGPITAPILLAGLVLVVAGALATRRRRAARSRPTGP